MSSQTTLTEPSSEAGFSLIEVLAAVTVFALISVLRIGLLTTALRGKEASEDALDGLAAVQRINALLRDDVGQMVMRSVRREDGLQDPRVFALDVDGADPLTPSREDEPREVLVLTRTGWANPGGLQPRSGLQRVAWIYDGQDLYRETGPYPDPASGLRPTRQLIAEGVSDLELEALIGGQWSSVVLARTSADGEARSAPPRAVRVRYQHVSLGRMEHLLLSSNAETDG